MKIGQQDIDSAKPIARRDEDRGVAAERLDGAVLARRAFQQPQRGGADRDDAAALARVPRSAPPPSRAEMQPHSACIRCSEVSSDLDRQERPCPDMQRQAMDVDAAAAQRSPPAPA